MDRVAIYCRVSTAHQGNDLQKTELESYSKLRGWNLKYVFEDKSTGTNTSRDGLKELLAKARTREIDIILIWKLDRFFRSLRDLVNTISELEELGVSLVSLKDQIDLTTSTGRLMVHLLGAFAQFEADLIRSRVIAGIEKAKSKGTKLGRPRLNKELEILALRERGYSYQKIQMKLGVSKGAVWRALKKHPKNPSKSSVLNVGNKGNRDDDI